MKQKLIIFTVLISTLLIGLVSAQNMTVSDLGLSGPQTIQIYGSSGTLLGTYNTTSNGIPLPTDDFSLVLKPATTARYVDNPKNLLDDGINYILSYALPIFIILGLLVAAMALAGYGRRR
jgi:hypothetical protein